MFSKFSHVNTLLKQLFKMCAFSVSPWFSALFLLFYVPGADLDLVWEFQYLQNALGFCLIFCALYLLKVGAELLDHFGRCIFLMPHVFL